LCLSITSWVNELHNQQKNGRIVVIQLRYNYVKTNTKRNTYNKKEALTNHGKSPQQNLTKNSHYKKPTTNSRDEKLGKYEAWSKF